MSVENFKKFGQMCADNIEVRNKAKEIGEYNVEGLVAYSKELGLEFSVEDMQAVVDEAGITQDELSEEQLEQIAGGVATTTAGAVVAVVVGVVIIGAAVKRW